MKDGSTNKAPIAGEPVAASPPAAVNEPAPAGASTTATIGFAPATPADAEALALLRVEAMRESLERIGRFNLERARQRFLSSFEPAYTRHILADGRRVGFVVVRPYQGELLLDHLYVRPSQQGRGIGGAVLQQVFGEADAARLPLRVGALRESESNRFYERHGFVLVERSEWDNHYLRPAAAA